MNIETLKKELQVLDKEITSEINSFVVDYSAYVYNNQMESKEKKDDFKVILFALFLRRGLVLTEKISKEYSVKQVNVEKIYNRKINGLTLKGRIHRYVTVLSSIIATNAKIAQKYHIPIFDAIMNTNLAIMNTNKLKVIKWGKAKKANLSEIEATIDKLQKEIKEDSKQGISYSLIDNFINLGNDSISAVYRYSEHEYLKQFKGQYIHIDPSRHVVVDICDHLQGNYPADFVFTGWHPNCYCISEPIRGTKVKDISISNKEYVDKNIKYFKNSPFYTGNRKYYENKN